MRIRLHLKPVGRNLLLFILLLFPGMSLIGLIIGSGLFSATLLLAMFEGVSGMIIAVSLNLIGAVCTYAQYLSLDSEAHLVSAVFQVGVAVACGLVGIMSDKQMKLNDRLEKIAYVDLTTGAYSHRYFHERYDERKSLQGLDVQDGLILFDIDNFNQINEDHGYDYGDAVLQHVVKVIQPLCSVEMSLCRLGGDVFGIYCPDFTLNRIRETVMTFQAKMKENDAVTLGTTTKRISASFGIAQYPSASSSMDHLLQDSFSALNRAKNSGKDNVKIFKNMVNEIKGLVASDPQMEVSLKVMLGLINKKDTYTEGHCLRVADYIYEFGETLDIEAEVLGQLKVVSLLHDIGKVNIPIEILTKPGKLSHDEYKIIQSHVELGAEFVKKINFVTDFSEIILYHHERYDGQGYPHGLSGEEIPYYARVIGIVDAYDAMISNRPYRAPLTKDEIIHQFHLGRGTQFDPELADRFIELLETDYFQAIESA